MDNLLIYICVPLISILLALTFLLRPCRNLPPSPLFALPIIGHLHLIRHPVHQVFHKLSHKYGHVFSLRFGSRLVVVVSSSSAVQECFTKNDIVLANRPLLSTGKYLAYNNTLLAVSPYGKHWRNLRRISTVEIFSATRLNIFSGIRQDEVKRLLHKLCSNSIEKFTSVKLEPLFLDLTYNILMRMVAGKRYYGDDVTDERKAEQFREIVKQVLAYAGATNPGDFVPIWNWIDPTGLENKMMKLGEKTDQMFQDLIDEIRNKKQRPNSMIDHLLFLQNTQPDNFTDEIIKGLVHVILLAGIDTTAVTLEWALSHLLNNLEVLNKARDEIDSLIGQERLVEEADLPRLRYLQGIISETLRLTPAAPLLVPHCATQDCKIEGFDVPRDTIVFINAWAIHRDPNLWEDAMSFKPERHEDMTELGAESYKLLPFGLGRRTCPGVGLAQRMVGLTLASLIQCFDWERMNNELIVMSEGEGLTMPRSQPLEAKCKPRPIIRAMLQEAYI